MDTSNIRQHCPEVETLMGGKMPFITRYGITLVLIAIIVVVSGRTRQTLWSAVQMLTQKLCCQTIHDCPKVVPLHYESE